MHSEFRTLAVAVDFARACSLIKIPRHLKEQLNRSSASVALNLAEGSAKDSQADRYRAYRIALGSFRESETILRIGAVDNPELNALKRKLAAYMTNLCKSLK